MEKQELFRNIFVVLPATFKKLIGSFNCNDMSKQQLMLLHAISHNDNMPMGFYSERLMISKSNLTALADKLIETGYIKRYTAPEDRRVINLGITPKGREYIERVFPMILDEARKKFEKTDESTLIRLNELMMELSEILNSIEGTVEE